MYWGSFVQSRINEFLIRSNEKLHVVLSDQMFCYLRAYDQTMPLFMKCVIQIMDASFMHIRHGYH